MLHNHRLLDTAAWGMAAIAGVSFWQHFALGVTILVGLGSLSLIILRWHDRLKYGPLGDRE
jgi:site-specific recombinase